MNSESFQNSFITPEMMYCFTLLQSQGFSNEFDQLVTIFNFNNYPAESCYIPSPKINMSGVNFSFEPFLEQQKPMQKNATKECYSDQDVNESSQKQVRVSKKEKPQRTQKSNRNISSNILKHFLVYIKNRELVAPVIQRLSKMIKIEITYYSFMQTLKFKFRKIHNYIRPNFFRQLCFGVNCDQNFSKVLRILFRRFVKQQFGLKIQHATKVGRGVKYQQIKGAKRLLIDIFRKDS